MEYILLSVSIGYIIFVIWYLNSNINSINNINEYDNVSELLALAEFY